MPRIKTLKNNFLILLLISAFYSYSQQNELFELLPPDQKQFPINTWNNYFKKINNGKDINKVYLLGFIVEPQLYEELEKTGKISHPWLPAFDVSKFKMEFKVAHPKNAAKDFQLIYPTKIIDPIKRSTLFILTENSKIADYLKNNRVEFSIVPCSDCNDSKSPEKQIFKLQNIESSSDFEWNVNLLIHNLSNLKLEEPEKKKDELKNSFELNFSQSLFAAQNYNSEISNIKNIKANFNSVDFNFKTSINQRLKILIGSSIHNLSGGIKSDKISYSFSDYTPQGLYIDRINTINNFSETWKADNCISLNTGLVFSFSKSEKLNLSSTISVGKFLPIVARTSVDNATFNYEAKLDGINDTLKNIQSLGLLNNVQYTNGLYETLNFTGSRYQFQLNASYNLNPVFYIQGLLSFTMIHLRNVNYKANLPISKSYGDFSSSYNNVKSMTLLPFSIGLGVGIKF
jgi:hypothetical protein